MLFSVFMRKWGWALGVGCALLLALVVLANQLGVGADQQFAARLVIYNQPVTVLHAMQVSTPSASVSASSGSRPHAVLSSELFDFGVVGASAVVSHDFFIINRGSAPLVIYQAATTCGCATAALTASIIPPGKASRATVTFNAGYHPVAGTTVRRGLILETNDPDRPELAIWVQAAVIK